MAHLKFSDLANQKIALLHLLCILIFASILKYANYPFDSSLYKLLAGFILGTYGAWGKHIFIELVNLAWVRRLDVIDKKILPRMFMISGLILLMLIGLYSWIVGWEGNTGYVYGIGVLVGMTLYDFGIRVLFSSALSVDQV